MHTGIVKGEGSEGKKTPSITKNKMKKKGHVLLRRIYGRVTERLATEGKV